MGSRPNSLKDADLALPSRRPEWIHDHEFTEGLSVPEVFGPETPRAAANRGLDDRAVPEPERKVSGFSPLQGSDNQRH